MALVCTALSALAAAWAGSALGRALVPMLDILLVGLAAAVALFLAIRPAAVRMPEEPTRSLGAISLALLARQSCDPVRLIVFAMGLAGVEPLLAAASGAVGGGSALALAWRGGQVHR